MNLKFININELFLNYLVLLAYFLHFLQGAANILASLKADIGSRGASTELGAKALNIDCLLYDTERAQLRQ